MLFKEYFELKILPQACHSLSSIIFKATTLTHGNRTRNCGYIEIYLTMELFSRRRWTTGSAQQSYVNGMIPCMCCIIFLVCQIHNNFPLGPIQSSSLSIKEFHNLTVALLDFSLTWCGNWAGGVDGTTRAAGLRGWLSFTPESVAVVDLTGDRIRPW